MTNLPYLLESNAHLLSDKTSPKILCTLELSGNKRHRYHIVIGNKMAASYALQPLSNGHCQKNERVALQSFAHRFCSFCVAVGPTRNDAMTHVMGRPMILTTPAWPTKVSTSSMESPRCPAVPQLSVAFTRTTHVQLLVVAFFLRIRTEPETHSRVHCLTTEIATIQSRKPRPGHA